MFHKLFLVPTQSTPRRGFFAAMLLVILMLLATVLLVILVVIASSLLLLAVFFEATTELYKTKRAVRKFSSDKCTSVGKIDIPGRTHDHRML